MSNKQELGSENEFLSPVQELASTAKDYIDIRIEQAKLDVTDGLAKGFGKVTGALVIMELVVVSLTLLGAALVLLLGELMHSYTYAALIVTLIYILLPLIVYLLRNKLFVKPFEKIFTGIFFAERGVSDLEKARIQIESERSAIEKELSYRTKYLHAVYSPSNIFGKIMQKTAVIKSVVQFAAQIYQGVKGAFKKEDAPAEPTPGQSTQE